MKIIRQLLYIDFVRFCIVGALGFIINFVFLSLFFKYLGLNIFIAQLVSAELSLFNNFIFHHNWTYNRAEKDMSKNFINYVIEFHVTSWVAILASTLIVGFLVEAVGLTYYVALIASSIVALFWNYFWTKYYIWANKPKINNKAE